MNLPTIETHIPVKVPMPPEPNELAVGRPDLPVPSLWQQTVSVTHKATGRKAVIARVDHSMCMFRAYYPDTQEFAPRTEWQHFRDWQPEVTFSPAELERQAALAAYEAELQKLDAKQLGVAAILCEDADPAKSLAKLRVMISAGLIQLPDSAVTEQAVAEVAKKRSRKPATPKETNEG